MNEQSTPRPKLWTGTFIRVGLASLVLNISVSMVFSAFSLFLGGKGASASLIGTTASLYTVFAMTMRLLAGNLVDSRGRRTVGMLGVVLFALPLFGYILAPILAAIILFRMVQGLGSSAGTICIGTMAADVLPPERFAEGIGYYGLFVSAAGAIAPALGLELIMRDPSGRTLFIATIAMTALTGVLIMSLNYEKTDETFIAAREASRAQAALQEEEKSSFFLWNFFEKDALPSAGVSFLMACGFCSLSLFLAPYALSRGIESVGIFFTVQASCMFIMRLVSGKLSNAIGIVRTLGIGLFCGGVALFLLSRLNSFVLMITAAVFCGCGGGLAYPILNIMAVQNAPANRRGKATSTYYAAFDIGMGFGGLMYGLLIDFTGRYDIVFAVGAAFLFADIIIASILFKGKNKNQA